MAEEIKRKSQEISADCIDEKMHTTSSLIDRVFIKQHMQMNSTCLKLQFQGTRATKLFMGWYSIFRRSKAAGKVVGKSEIRRTFGVNRRTDSLF